MSNIPCPYCGDEPESTGRIVVCKTKTCPNLGHQMYKCKWNRRFVRLDVKGGKVYSDSLVIGTMGDGSEHECLLQYKDYQWWATDTQATFGIRMSFKLCEFDQIELVESDGG